MSPFLARAEMNLTYLGDTYEKQKPSFIDYQFSVRARV